jgi:hypothetical protein
VPYYNLEVSGKQAINLSSGLPVDTRVLETSLLVMKNFAREAAGENFLVSPICESELVKALAATGCLTYGRCAELSCISHGKAVWKITPKIPSRLISSGL